MNVIARSLLVPSCPLVELVALLFRPMDAQSAITIVEEEHSSLRIACNNKT